MLRAARLLLQRRTALGAATAPAIGPLARTQHLPLPWQRTAAPALGLRSCLFASKAAREQGERKDDGKGKDGGASKGKRSLKQRLKETPVDPRLYQHLERLGLGAESTRRPPKGQRRRKQRVTVDMDQVEARLKKESIPYFQANRFTQAKRAVRRERRRLVREASNRLHLLNKAQVDRHEQRVKEKSWQRLMQTQQQGQRQRPQVREHRAEEDGEDGEGGSDGDGDDDRARRLSRLFRASAASGSVRFATAAFRYVDLPSPLSLVVHGNEQRGRGPRVVPEVALAGRSNVGKSTLLNALLGLQARRGAAAVGDKPGVTKSLDFYRIGSRSNPRLVVVDLPGYGFAFGKEERVEQSQQLTLAYLRHRGAPLKRLLLLLDARHGLKHQDRAFLQRLYAAPSEQEEEEVKGEEDEEEEEESDDGRRYPSVWDASDDHAIRHTSDKKTGPPTPEHDDDGPHPPPTATLLPLPPFRPPKLQVVFTKCDLLPRDDLARRILLTRRELEEELGLGLLDMGLLGGRVVLPKALVAGLPSLMVAAGRGRKGLVELQAELAALLPPLPQVPAPSSSSHNHQHHQQQQPQQHQRSRSPEWPKGPQRQRQGQERRRKEARGEKGMGGSKGQQRWGGRR